MAQRGRPGISSGQKDRIWELWRKGKSLSDISRDIGKKPGTVFGVLRLHGGITPSVRQRSELSLSLEEREEISRGRDKVALPHSLHRFVFTGCSWLGSE